MRILLLLLLTVAYLASPVLLASLFYGGLPPLWLVLLVAVPWIFFLPKAQAWMMRIAMPKVAGIHAKVAAVEAQMRQRLEAFCRQERVTSDAAVTLDPVLPTLYLTRADGTECAYAIVPVGSTLTATGPETWIWAWADPALPARWRDEARSLQPLRETDWGKEVLWREQVDLDGADDRFPVSCSAMALDLLQARTVWLVPWNGGVLYALIHGVGEARA
jgi:hypothetical protein